MITQATPIYYNYFSGTQVTLEVAKHFKAAMNIREVSLQDYSQPSLSHDYELTLPYYDSKIIIDMDMCSVE